MSNEQIILNDIELELSGKTSIALTSQINDLSKGTSQESNFTNTVKAPPTPRNLAAIENSDQVQSESIVPYSKNRAKINKFGVDVLKNGFAVLSSVDKEINLVIYEGNVDFFAAIEGKTLRDLDLSALSHLFDWTNVTGSFTNDSTDGYKYPLIDYGMMPSDIRELDPQYLKATVFCAYIFEKIITEAGFTFEGNIFSNEKFKKLLITTEDDNKGTYFDTYANIETGLGQIYNFPIDPSQKTRIATFTKGAGESWQYEVTINFTISGWVNGTSFFIITTGFGWLAIFAYQHSDADGDGTFTKTFTFDSSVYINTVDIHDSLVYDLGQATVVVHFGEMSGRISGETEDRFFVHLLPIASQTASTTDSYYAEFGIDYKNQYGFTTIDVAQVLPEWTQKDFVKAMANIFNLMFSTNKTENKLTIKQFSEIVDDIPNALDWTTKLHSDENSQTKEFRIGGYSQINNCKYTEDDSDIKKPKKYGNGTLTVADEVLPKETTFIELPFSSSLSVSRLLGIIVPSVNRVDADGEFTIDTVPRLLIDNVDDILDSNGDLELNDGPNSSAINTGIPYCYFIQSDKTFNLGFNNSLLLDNYSALTRVLNKSKKLTVLMKLSAVDFYNLDHFKPIYLAQFASYFYINKVINWTGEGITKVEIIRIGQRNDALIGLIARYRADYDTSSSYGQINRDWGSVGIATFTMTSLIIDGVELATNQQLIINAPGDLVVGIGIDGLPYVTNVSDWVTSLMPDGFTMRDNGQCIDVPADSRFLIGIYYEETGPLGDYGLYTYTNEGFSIPGWAGIYHDYIKENIF